jgi:hypothetical protein
MPLFTAEPGQIDLDRRNESILWKDIHLASRSAVFQSANGHCNHLRGHLPFHCVLHDNSD